MKRIPINERNWNDDDLKVSKITLKDNENCVQEFVTNAAKNFNKMHIEIKIGERNILFFRNNFINK